ncbi:Integrase core domain [Popillia japonica]|uniref:Integrase core domain n=1 Tax=Popillia japonica TaxID=7064 RepID=A0AAW1M3G6_POPJA
MSNPEPNSTENTTQLPIEFLCKLIPREFNGNRYEVGQFLADSKISGRAKEQLAQQQFSDWPTLKNKLKTLYQDKKHYAQIMEELNNCRQYPKESVNDFFQRLEVLNSRALSTIKLNTQDESVRNGKTQAINEITLNRFIFHSRPEISQMLRWKDFNDLNSAFTAAVSEERAFNIRPNKKFCNICKRDNHNTFECRFKQNQPSTSKKPVYLSKQVQSNVMCKYCKKNGHSINECFKLKNKKQLEQKGNYENQTVSKNQENTTVHLNCPKSAVTNTPLSDQISQLSVFEN